ncbi:type II toxin-antitoxin system RelB family antitoxin [Pseudomonas putida]
MLTIELPPDVEGRLDQLAASTGKTKEYYAQQAVALHLDDLEELYIAEQRMRDINNGASTTIALEDLDFD